MTTTYTRLNAEDRETISRGLAAGWKLKTIAALIRRHPSTVTNEVRNNCRYRRCYRALSAQDRAVGRRHRSTQPKKLDRYPLLQAYVFSRLRQQWSPEEIAKRLCHEYPDRSVMRISHESIYSYIYVLPKGALRQELIQCLRQERRLRTKRKHGHAQHGRITGAISITERPREVADRTVPGHWEGDLVMGSKASNSALGTLVERVTRYTLLIPLTGHDAVTVRQAFTRAVQAIPRHLKLSLTYDRGLEMAEHAIFTAHTKVKVFFADPYSPWQRGTNENTNGLLRQYFPKGTDFRTIARQDIQRVQDLLNDRPRKVLHFQKPDEVFPRLLIHKKLR